MEGTASTDPGSSGLVIGMPSMECPTMAQAKLYLTTKQAADLIGMSESFLNQDRYVAKAAGTPPKFPFIRIGRTIKYDRELLLQVMENGTVA
jgi:hypothetical protein